MMQACNPSTLEGSRDREQEFETTLGYTSSSSSMLAWYRDSASKQNKKQKWMEDPSKHFSKDNKTCKQIHTGNVQYPSRQGNANQFFSTFVCVCIWGLCVCVCVWDLCVCMRCVYVYMRSVCVYEICVCVWYLSVCMRFMCVCTKCVCIWDVYMRIRSLCVCEIVCIWNLSVCVCVLSSNSGPHVCVASAFPPEPSPNSLNTS